MSDLLSVLNSNSLAIRTPDPLPDAVSDNQEQFLRVRLMPNTVALLPIQQVTEVLTISSGQIVPIPHMPAWVMGVYNWRGEILWMVDLGHLCGLPSWYEQATNISVHKAITLQVHGTQRESAHSKGQTLGLVVDRVEDIEWCNLDEIQSLPLSTVNPELARFLHGFWWKSNDDMLAILNGEAILGAMPQ